jgi:hypothetical protein
MQEATIWEAYAWRNGSGVLAHFVPLSWKPIELKETYTDSKTCV